MWFDSWQDLLAIFVKALCAYALLIVYIRLSGKRSTSRMNNFDWIVTVGVGSIFASMILMEDISFSEGAFAIGFLLLLQHLLTEATTRWKWVHDAAVAPPQALYSRGTFRRRAMRAERVSEDDLLSAVREHGIASLAQVEAIVLEPDAQFSILAKAEDSSPGRVWTEVDGFGSDERGD